MADFKCKKCDHLTHVPRVVYVYSDGEMVPRYPVKCEKCGGETLETKKEFTGVPAFGKFSSASDEEKKRILSKRAKSHYNKTGKEHKRENFKKVMSNVKKEK